MGSTSGYLLSEVGGRKEAERLRRQAGATLGQEVELVLRQLPQSATLVDLGCGTGLLDDAVARARPDVQVHGVDADPMSVAEAKRVFGGLDNLAFHQASIDDGPSGSVPVADLVVLRLVLLHLPDASGALEQCRSWVGPGGKLMVLECDDRAVEMEPRPTWLDQLLDLMESVQQARGGSRRRGLELGRLLEGAGWELEAYGRLGFSMKALGGGFGRLFLPVAKFYLAEAIRRGLAQEALATDLEGKLALALDGGLEQAMVPLFYALASPPSLG